MADPRVVVIVPCAASNPYVEECLARCRELEFDDFLVVLLPDGPVALPEPLRGAGVEVLPTGDVSIAAKRNRAIRAHPGAKYYAMIDSDAFPDPAWLREGISGFARPEAPWAVGGPNVTPPGDGAGQRASGAAARSIMVSGYGAFAKRRSPSRLALSLTSCNLIVQGEAMRSLGGFREELETAEDRDLCARILAAGGRIWFHREAVVYHHERPLGTPLFMQRLTYGWWAVAACRRKRTAFELAQLVPLTAAIAMVAGLALWAVHPVAGFAGLAVFLAYAGLLLAETVRHAESPRQAPLVLLAIVVANAGFLAGNLLALGGRRLNLKSAYRNYHPAAALGSRAAPEPTARRPADTAGPLAGGATEP